MQYFNLGGGNSIRLATGTPVPTVDPDAQAFITAAAITDPTQQAAINTLVVDLKGYGVWTKMKALYPFVGGTASQHKFNLKDSRDLDAAFRLTFNGGWTHSANGAQPNGTNGFADTKFIPSSNQLLNSNGLGVYITQNSSGRPDPIIMGSFNGTLQASLLVSTSTNLLTRLNGNIVSNAITGGLGSFDIQKTSSTVTKIYKNGILLNTGNSGGTLPIVNNFIGTMNYIGTPYGDGYVNSQFRFAYLSDGLSDTEIANLRTSVQTFQTALNRNV
jgi:hypothetical protein